MAAPSASILSFVIFIITISSSCYAPAALAVPETGEVAFPSQAILPIGGILNPPPTILPNLSNIFPAANINFTISISVSVVESLSNVTLLNLTFPIIIIPNASLPNTSLPNIPFPNITLPNGTAIPPLTINVNVSIPEMLPFGFSLNIVNGFLSGLFHAAELGGFFPNVFPLSISGYAIFTLFSNTSLILISDVS